MRRPDSAASARAPRLGRSNRSATRRHATGSLHRLRGARVAPIEHVFYRQGMSNAAVLQQHSLWGNCPLEARPVLASPLRLDDTSVVLHQIDWLVGADAVFGELARSVAWQHVNRPMYDRVVDVPRLVATIERADLADGHVAAVIVDAVAELLGAPVERMGANLYRDGGDSVAWHRDRIGSERDWSVIVLVSLGGPRTLQLRPWRAGVGAGRRKAI